MSGRRAAPRGAAPAHAGRHLWPGAAGGGAADGGRQARAGQADGGFPVLAVSAALYPHGGGRHGGLGPDRREPDPHFHRPASRDLGGHGGGRQGHPEDHGQGGEKWLNLSGPSAYGA